MFWFLDNSEIVFTVFRKVFWKRKRGFWAEEICGLRAEIIEVCRIPASSVFFQA